MSNALAESGYSFELAVSPSATSTLQNDCGSDTCAICSDGHLQIALNPDLAVSEFSDNFRELVRDFGGPVLRQSCESQALTMTDQWASLVLFNARQTSWLEMPSIQVSVLPSSFRCRSRKANTTVSIDDWNAFCFPKSTSDCVDVTPEKDERDRPLANTYITEDANEYLTEAGVTDRLMSCLEMIGTAISSSARRIDLAIDPTDDEPVTYLEMSIDTEMPRREFRKAVLGLYRDFRAQGFSDIGDILVMRRS